MCISVIIFQYTDNSERLEMIEMKIRYVLNTNNMKQYVYIYIYIQTPTPIDTYWR